MGDTLGFYSFEPVEGEVRIPLHSSGNGWNLVGNPYSSSLALNDLSSHVQGGTLQQNISYYWDEQIGSYIATSVSATVPVYKGFFVQNKVDGTGASSLVLNNQIASPKENNDENHNKQVVFALSLTYRSIDSTRKYIDNALGYLFREDAQLGRDSYDGNKLIPFSFYDNKGAYRSYMTASLDGQGMAYISLPLEPDDDEPSTIYHHWTLNDQGQDGGHYRLTWKWIGPKADHEIGYFRIYDKLLDVWIDSRQQTSYEFAVDKNTKQEIQYNPSIWTANISNDIQYQHHDKINTDDQARFTFYFVYSAASTTDIIPSDYVLRPNYPNPFNPTTTIEFGLPEQATVNLQIYNILGQQVQTIINNQSMSAGTYRYQWGNANISSGIYFYVIQANHFRKIGKMTLIK